MPSLGNSMERMKHLLSTGEHSDVHFLVGDGDAKEVLPAHQLILKNASDVFEEMFRCNAKKKRTENASVNCPVVEVPDVEAAAFKVMLSFIYTDDLSELNEHNAMAVLYAAKKYNIPGLVRPSLQIPFSELRNIFFAYAQARVFDLEDFSLKYLRYICQNAETLFKSKEFLHIDQKMLCNLLDNDRLLLNDEFEIWKDALRWADEKCRQNGIECSSGNRRSVLGPALFKIRFPNIHEEDFTKCVVQSGVLTEKEVIGVYQFYCNPTVLVMTGLFSLKFPSHGRISDWNKAKDNGRGTIALEIEKVSEFAGEPEGSYRFGEAVFIKGLAWKIEAEIIKNTEGTDEKCLGFFLWCDSREGGPWNCVFSATYRIVSEENNGKENSIGTRCDCVLNQYHAYTAPGFASFISFTEMMDPSNGFYNTEKDKVTLVINFTVKKEKIDKFILDQSKSKGKLIMEIEKVSEFARENFGSERKSETVTYIKGFPWKILAQIQKEDESTDKNEKWLDIYLLCDASEEDENWSCKCSSSFRIVSKKSGIGDYKIGELTEEETYNCKTNSWGYNLISFAELMNPRRGFYNRREDKVTLAIDFTVNEAKMESKS
ncbi:hypothetical protein niasHT_028810 [Heterodera trifolii]|uniref:BTB/POZ domain-containing protein n=1 Tax=Heterodera trifolii TaxID=157864 RepID=A0ABD2KQF9_9BILA